MALTEELKAIRKDILKASHLGKDGNLQSCFSSVEILWTLYNGIMRVSPETVKRDGHDRFILSKGQSNLALLAVLAHKGYLLVEELKSFCRFDSRIAMQADRTKFDGLIENSAGSLGHGFPMAVGMAWAAKMKRSVEHVYVLAGDGEVNEGSVWEGAIFAASEKLDNLTLIVDDNNSISHMLDIGDMTVKFEAFGFSVQTADGHDINSLSAALKASAAGKPTAIIAKTKRGYGSVTLMNECAWFHRWPDDNDLVKLIAEVDAF